LKKFFETFSSKIFPSDFFHEKKCLKKMKILEKFKFNASISGPQISISQREKEAIISVFGNLFEVFNY